MVREKDRNDDEADFGDYDLDFDRDENERVHRKADRLARELEQSQLLTEKDLRHRDRE